MVTLVTIFQYLIQKQAAEIHQLKNRELVRDTVEKYAYLSPDGKQFRNRLPAESELAAGWRWSKVKFERLIGHISPRHPQWRYYQAAKHRASLLLTARLILKLDQQGVPTFAAVRAALRKGLLTNHASAGKARALCVRAFRYLKKIENRLNKAPARFEPVELWLNSNNPDHAATQIEQGDSV